MASFESTVNGLQKPLSKSEKKVISSTLETSLKATRNQLEGFLSFNKIMIKHPHILCELAYFSFTFLCCFSGTVVIFWIGWG